MTLDLHTRFNLVTKNIKFKLKIMSIVLALISLVAIVSMKSSRDFLEMLLQHLTKLPRSGESIALLFLLYMLANSPTMVPTNGLHVACGMIFGLLQGSIVALICYVITAFIPFVCVRRCFRKKVDDWLCDSKYYSLISAINEQPFAMMTLARFSAVIPGSLNNVMFGLTNVTDIQYIMASLIGIAPQLIFYVYIGTLVGNFSHLGKQLSQASIATTCLLALGIGSTVVMMVYLVIKCNHIINNKLHPTRTMEGLSDSII